MMKDSEIISYKRTFMVPLRVRFVDDDEGLLSHVKVGEVMVIVQLDSRHEYNFDWKWLEDDIITPDMISNTISTQIYKKVELQIIEKLSELYNPEYVKDPTISKYWWIFRRKKTREQNHETSDS